MHVVFPCFRVCLTCKSRRSSVSCQYSVSCTTRGISLISVIYRFHLSVASASLVSFCEKAVLSLSCSAKNIDKKVLPTFLAVFVKTKETCFLHLDCIISSHSWLSFYWFFSWQRSMAHEALQGVQLQRTRSAYRQRPSSSAPQSSNAVPTDPPRNGVSVLCS